MIVENDCYRIQVEDDTGALRSACDKRAGLELIAEPRLAESFRLLVPLPHLEANYIRGVEQRPSSVADTGSGAVIRAMKWFVGTVLVL